MNRKTADDINFMREAVRLAKKGVGETNPNPIVGAVIVRKGEIIGKGYHKKYGDCHAEINAINNASGSVTGSTLYITLEPCCHQGKTPPCVEALIKEKIKRVVVGTFDPNPKVSGKGIRALRASNVVVDVGILEDECLLLNEHYFKFIKSGIPYVTVKYAQTLDGNIATRTGDSRWISSEASRKYVHRLRSQNDCIMVGVGTVTTDNPKLTVRHVKGKNPLRIIVDSRLRVPLNSHVLTDDNPQSTMVATTSKAPSGKVNTLKNMGVEILKIKEDKRKRVDLKSLLSKLGKRNIVSVMVEGGPEIITSLLKANLVDKMIVFTAPKITGTGLNAIGDLNISQIKDAIKFSSFKTMRKDGDIVFVGTI